MAFPVERKTRLVRAGSGADLSSVIDRFETASFGLPFSRPGLCYYQTLASPDFVEASFALVDDEGPLVLVACDTMIADRLGRYGFPIEIWERPNLSGGQRRRIARDVLGELGRIAGEHKRPSTWLRTSAALDPLGIYAARLADVGAAIEPTLRALLDLAQDDASLLEDMRKGHRQQVRWGAANLEIAAVDAANPDRGAFEAFRALHAEIAGRVTRPRESWDAMFALIADGFGDLVLCHVDGALMGGTLILDDANVAYYSSGAYRRENFDKPLTHYPLFLAATRARARGRKRFDIGETMGGTMNMDDQKERSIGRFKSGFSGRADVSFIWTIPGKPE